MKPKLILMSHGKMAAETLHSAKMITGDLANAAIVSMAETDGLSGTTEKLKKILESPDQEPTLILTDLKGGTPCNAAMMQMDSRPNLRVLSGLNLAMVIEAVLSPIEDLDELVDHLLMIGKNAVEKVELPDFDEELEYEE
jgi:PTS system mannose-specific IIA component